MDLNLIDNAIRYKFTDAPILSVSIAEHNDKVIVLVATVSSVHYLKFSHPNRIQKCQDETQFYSVFHDACTGQTNRDPSFFHVINQTNASSELNLEEKSPFQIRFELDKNTEEEYSKISLQFFI